MIQSNKSSQNLMVINFFPNFVTVMISLFLFSFLELLISLGILNQPRSPSTEEVEFKDSGNEVVKQTTAIIHTSPQGLGK